MLDIDSQVASGEVGEASCPGLKTLEADDATSHHDREPVKVELNPNHLANKLRKRMAKVKGNL